MKKKVIAIVGPTASGKTGIGIRLAKEFSAKGRPASGWDGAEIVSADSRQVFRRLDIGTGKDLREYGDVPYHMIDIIDPCTTDEYRAGLVTKMTLFDYLPLARRAIEDIIERGKLPIIVGGTGLYVQGLVEGFALEQNPKSEIRNPKQIPNSKNKKLKRGQLNNETIEQLNNVLKEIDPEKYETVDRKNRHRLIRAIELAQDGLKPIKVKPDFEVLQIGVDLSRKELFERIDIRVDEWFEAGLLEEVQGLLDSGVSAEWLMQLGLEYRGVTQFLLKCHFDPVSSAERLEKSCCLCDRILTPCSTHLAGGLAMAQDDSGVEFETMKQDLKFKTHQFARRQLTWLRRFPEINWLSDFSEMERFVKIFLEH